MGEQVRSPGFQIVRVGYNRGRRVDDESSNGHVCPGYQIESLT